MARTGLLLALALSALCGCVAAVVGSGGGNQGGTGRRAPRPRSQADAAVTAEVKSRLAADASLAAGSISVDTRDGIVTLRGRVASSAQRAAAERDAWARVAA